MKKLINFQTHVGLKLNANVINENKLADEMDIVELKKKMMEIIYQSTNAQELEDLLEENGFENGLSFGIEDMCEEVATSIFSEREHDTRMRKIKSNESEFTKLFIDYMIDKIDTDFPNIQVAPIKWIGGDMERILTHKANMIYNSHVTTPGNHYTSVSVYVESDELHIGFGEYDTTLNGQAYDITSMIQVIENRRTN
jgi:hypothetical protein